MVGLKRLFTVLLVAGILLAGGTSSVQAKSFCPTQMELAALKTRVLQSRLMVSALSCEMHTAYNQFMNTHKSYLQNQNSALRKFFTRHFGESAGKKMNNFITFTANEASRNSIKTALGEYCGHSEKLFGAAVQLNDLIELQTSQYLSDNFKACTDIRVAEAEEAIK